jgi:hypothetical protein
MVAGSARRGRSLDELGLHVLWPPRVTLGNLLRPEWSGLDSSDLRTLLDIRIGGPGQYTGRPKDNGCLFLPLADDNCRVMLKFEGTRISAVQPGKGFDQAQWAQISAEIDTHQS